MSDLAHCLESLFRLTCKRSSNSPAISLTGETEFRRSGQLESSGQSVREERSARRGIGRSAEGPSGLFLRTHVWMHVRKLFQVEERPPERSRRSNPQMSYRSRNSSCSYQPQWKDLINEPSGMVHRRVLVSSRPVIPRLKIALNLPQ